MKKAFKLILGTVVIATMFSVQSCNKVKDAIAKNLSSFNTTPPTLTYDIPIISSTSQFAQYDTAVINIDQLIQDNAGSGFSINNISKITINQIVLHLNNGDANNNWTNFSSAQCLLATSKSNANNLNAILATVSIPDIVANQYNDVVITGDPNLNIKDYFDGGATSVYYLIGAQARRATTVPLNITATITYTLTP